MSKNSANQDKIEQRCLTLLRGKLNKEYCFGLHDKEFLELKEWIKSAHLNESSTRFPDIIFEDGFIEHFGITSSYEGKKGAKQTRESSNFKKNSETNFLKSLNDSDENELTSSFFGRPFEEHSYSHIINSIQKNWLKHIRSYRNSKSLYKHRIFLLEYIDTNIETAVTKKDELSKTYHSYRISTDKFLLEWIYGFKEEIDFLILVNHLPFSLEVIKLDTIPEILKEDQEVIYAPVDGIESHKFYGGKFRIDDTEFNTD